MHQLVRQNVPANLQMEGMHEAAPDVLTMEVLNGLKRANRFQIARLFYALMAVERTWPWPQGALLPNVIKALIVARIQHVELVRTSAFIPCSTQDCIQLPWHTVNMACCHTAPMPHSTHAKQHPYLTAPMPYSSHVGPYSIHAICRLRGPQLPNTLPPCDMTLDMYGPPCALRSVESLLQTWNSWLQLT